MRIVAVKLCAMLVVTVLRNDAVNTIVSLVLWIENNDIKNKSYNTKRKGAIEKWI